jgi:hypothetical protein
VLKTCPLLDMRCWQQLGVKLGEKPKSSHPIMGATGEGKAGRVKNMNPR